MDFNTLKYYVDVAELLNFTQAAKKNFISQPAMSANIKALEKEVGHALIVRDHHHVALTNSGETFLGYAKQLLETYNKALAALWQDSDYAETTLNVSMFLGPVFQPFVEQLTAFKKTYRNHFTVRINKRSSNDAIADVLGGTAQLGLAIVDHSIKPLAWRSVNTDEFVIVADTSILKQLRPLKISQLTNLKFLQPDEWPGQFFSNQINKLLAEGQFNGERESFTSLDLMMTELLMEPPFTILPKTQIPENMPGLESVPIKSNLSTHMTTGWCYLKSPMDSAVAAFLSYLPTL